jgi:hypothetical protein
VPLVSRRISRADDSKCGEFPELGRRKDAGPWRSFTTTISTAPVSLSPAPGRIGAKIRDGEPERCNQD